MKNPVGTLTGFRSRDVMRGDVVTVRAKDTMRQAASVLQSYGITGAPVVNDEGECVGVISSSDFVGREIASATIPSATALAFDSMYIKKTFSPPEQVEANLVETYMTKEVETVGVDDPMMKSARKLCEERIHRLVVVDKQNRPVGVISSLDIVACLVVAIEE